MQFCPSSPQDNENQTEEDCDVRREAQDSPRGMKMQQPECQDQEQEESYLEL